MVSFNSLQQWLSWQESFFPKAIEMGLERSATVFSKLQPDYRKPATITVAGTNGKGSCVAFLERIYCLQGYKVGTYTSPHILAYNERIKINGKNGSDELICQAFEHIEQVRNDTKLSYFEFGTLAALDIFQQQQVDVQILEVGLGGRLDAVNIIDTDVAIITSIGIDHEHYLGDTREAIAQEKAGIFRASVPAIVGDRNPPDSLLRLAAETKAVLNCIGQDFDCEHHSSNWNFVSKSDTLNRLPPPSLRGEHQFDNAAVAIQALLSLSDRLPVENDCIAHGISSTSLPGRFQIIRNERTTLLDVGHNPQAAETLVHFLQSQFASRNIYAVFAMMQDKDYATVISTLQPYVHRWFLPLLNTPRAASSDALSNCMTQQGIDSIQIGFDSLDHCMRKVNASTTEDDLILVFGSFYLVSEYLELTRQD